MLKPRTREDRCCCLDLAPECPLKALVLAVWASLWTWRQVEVWRQGCWGDHQITGGGWYGPPNGLVLDSQSKSSQLRCTKSKTGACLPSDLICHPGICSSLVHSCRIATCLAVMQQKGLYQSLKDGPPSLGISSSMTEQMNLCSLSSAQHQMFCDSNLEWTNVLGC